MATRATGPSPEGVLDGAAETLAAGYKPHKACIVRIEIIYVCHMHRFVPKCLPFYDGVLSG